MKKIGTVLSWIGAVFVALIALGALGSGDVFAGIILVVIAIALLPVSPIKDLWMKLPEKFKWAKGVGLTALFLIGMCTVSPAPETPPVTEPETSEQVIVTKEEKDDEKPVNKEEKKEEAGQQQKQTSERQEEKGEEHQNENQTPAVSSSATNENVPTTTTKASVTTTKAPVTTTTKAPVITTTKAPSTTTQAPTTTTAPPTTTTKAPSGGNGDPDNDDTNGQIVYKTPTGKRYHIDPQCGGKNSKQTTLGAARSAGLTPCKKCVG